MNINMINTLASALEERYDYRIGETPPTPKLSDREIFLLKKKLNADHSPGGVFEQSFLVHTDAGRHLAVEKKFERVMTDIGILSEAGILPKMEAPEIGLLMHAITMSSIGARDQDEFRLLHEMREQGLRGLNPSYVQRTPEEALDRLNIRFSEWADKNGYDVVSGTSLSAIRSFDDEELFKVFMKTNPEDGLSKFDEVIVRKQSVLLQKTVQNMTENSNIMTDYEKLMDLGILPKIRKIDDAPKSFIRVIIDKVSGLFDTLPDTKEAPYLIELGRDVLRSEITRRMDLDMGPGFSRPE